jgi:hypothetical protein
MSLIIENDSQYIKLRRLNRKPNVSKYASNWLKRIMYKNVFELNKSDTI